MPRLVAISDIHAHHTELMGLYQQLVDSGFNPQVDTLVGCGDYVDGGPDTKKVIDQLMAWEEQYPHWVFLKGNHGDLMLDALLWNSRKYGSWDIWYSQGGKRTALSYLPDGFSDYERAIVQPADYILKSHLEWIPNRPLTHEQDGYLFVHAGLRPHYTLADQSQEDLLWIREAFIDSDWDFYGKRVVAGHTPMPEPLVMPNKIMIDTMRGDFGKLTAVELDTTNNRADPRFFFQPAVKGAWEEFDGFR